MDASYADEIDSSNSFEDYVLKICSKSGVPKQKLKNKEKGLRVVL